MKSTVAYDLSQFAPEREQAQPKVVVVKHPKETKQQKQLKRLKIRCVILSVLLLVLMCVTVNSRTRLNETTTTIQKKNGELVALQSESTYLNYTLESLVSLKNAEEYAQNELGLIKLNSSQIEYVCLQDENYIESAEKVSGIMPFMKYMFSAVIDMFE